MDEYRPDICIACDQYAEPCGGQHKADEPGWDDLADAFFEEYPALARWDRRIEQQEFEERYANENRDG